jgi:hypothetical protein
LYWFWNRDSKTEIDPFVVDFNPISARARIYDDLGTDMGSWLVFPYATGKVNRADTFTIYLQHSDSKVRIFGFKHVTDA